MEGLGLSSLMYLFVRGEENRSMRREGAFWEVGKRGGGGKITSKNLRDVVKVMSVYTD